MDNTLIGILIGGGSLLTSAAAIGVNAYFRSRSDEREQRETSIEETTQRFNLMCHTNQGLLLKEARASDQRIHARVDGVERNVSDKILSISNDLSEIKGVLRTIQNSVNGDLEERISRAIKAAFDK